MKEVKQVRVKKTELDGSSRYMHIDEATWKNIVDSKSDMFGKFELAPAEPINSIPAELIGRIGHGPAPEPPNEPEHNEDSDLAYYRELGKEKGIPGAHKMKLETLKQKLA